MNRLLPTDVQWMPFFPSLRLSIYYTFNCCDFDLFCSERMSTTCEFQWPCWPCTVLLLQWSVSLTESRLIGVSWCYFSILFERCVCCVCHLSTSCAVQLTKCSVFGVRLSTLHLLHEHFPTWLMAQFKNVLRGRFGAARARLFPMYFRTYLCIPLRIKSTFLSFPPYYFQLFYLFVFVSGGIFWSGRSPGFRTPGLRHLSENSRSVLAPINTENSIQLPSL